MAPLTRMRATEPGGVPTELMADYYGQRASKGGLIITEATQISLQGKGVPGAPNIHTDEQQAGWARVADAVHAKGGYAFLQLWHTGRASHSSHHPDGSLPVSASAIAPAGEAIGANFQRYPRETPRELETEEIALVIEDYRTAGLRAIEAGFDGVEIHGANGYLVDQFLQDQSNRRTDRYGGSIDNRVRFLLEVTDALVGALGAGRVGVRLSPFGTFGDVADSDPEALFRHAVEALSPRGLAYLHLIEPRVNVGLREDHDPSKPASATALFRSAFSGPLITSGGFTKASARRATPTIRPCRTPTPEYENGPGVRCTQSPRPSSPLILHARRSGARRHARRTSRHDRHISSTIR